MNASICDLVEQESLMTQIDTVLGTILNVRLTAMSVILLTLSTAHSVLRKNYAFEQNMAFCVSPA